MFGIRLTQNSPNVLKCYTTSALRWGKKGLLSRVWLALLVPVSTRAVCTAVPGRNQKDVTLLPCD